MVFLEGQVHAQAGAPLHHSPLTEAKSRVLATKQAFGMAPFFIEKGETIFFCILTKCYSFNVHSSQMLYFFNVLLDFASIKISFINMFILFKELV